MTYTALAPERGRFHLIIGETNDVTWSDIEAGLSVDYDIVLLDQKYGSYNEYAQDMELMLAFGPGDDEPQVLKRHRLFVANLKEKFAREFPEWKLIVGDELKLDCDNDLTYPVSIQWEGIKDVEFVGQDS